MKVQQATPQVQQGLLKVSVPLRGSGDESIFKFHGPVILDDVSVPLRGSGDESVANVEAIQEVGVFQSPCGEVVMKASEANSGTCVRIKFQSPCGEVVMKATLTCHATHCQKSFSPLAGKW